MRQYTVTEKQNRASYREGVAITAKNLSDAKRKAARLQFFCGTVLEIADAAGPLAVKENGKWTDEY